MARVLAARIPELTKTQSAGDLRGLPLDPVDGFVLSLIDGQLPAADIAAVAALPEDKVLAALLKLEDLGLVVFQGPDSSTRFNRSAVRGPAIPREEPDDEPPKPTPPARDAGHPRFVSKHLDRRNPSGEGSGGTPAKKPSSAAVRRASTRIARHSDPGRKPSEPSMTARRRESQASLAASSPSEPPRRTSRRPKSGMETGVGLSSKPPRERSIPPARMELSEPEPPPASNPGPGVQATPGIQLDVEPGQHERIHSLFGSLGTLDHYALLGIPRDAGKKAIKRAYCALATHFHPDRFFRKNLGDSKPKVEAIFRRITEACDVLTDPARRLEYDGSLGPLPTLDAAPEAPPPNPAPAAETESPTPLREPRPVARSQTGRPPRRRTPAPASVQVPESKSDPPGAAAPPTGPTSPPQPEREPPDKDPAWRQAFARRLVGGGRLEARLSGAPQPVPATPSAGAGLPTGASREREPPTEGPLGSPSGPPNSMRIPAMPPPPGIGRTSFAPVSSGAPSTGGEVEPPPSSSSEALASLRRRYETRVGHERTVQLSKYLTLADAAQAKNDPVAALNALRIAVTIAPEDKELGARVARLEKDAAVALVDSNLRQVSQCQSSGDWAGVARAYTKVLLAYPDDPSHLDQAAMALLQSRGDLRQAVAHARKACMIAPKVAQYHVTLARAYTAAGLGVSATCELELALQLTPGDGAIKAMLEQVRRGL